MSFKLNQKHIGQRIALLRRTKGLSQEGLAKQLGISRPSLAQIELGNRGVNILELKQLSMILNFSLDAFMSNNFSVANEIQVETEPNLPNIEERISIPSLNLRKFKNVLLYMLEKCAGKPNVGETVLYKLLYFSDFNYYELYEEHLTGAVYRKLAYGPVPQKMDSILKQMVENGQLKRVQTKYFDFTQTRYLPLEKADLAELKASEKEVIDKVIDQMSDWSATAISNYSHKDIPWLATKESEEINYELAFYREIPFTVRNYIDENAG